MRLYQKHAFGFEIFKREELTFFFNDTLKFALGSGDALGNEVIDTANEHPVPAETQTMTTL